MIWANVTKLQTSQTSLPPQIFLSWYGYVRLCIYMYITVVMGAVKIIKYIRNRVLHLRVFEALCERMGLQHHHLIFLCRSDTVLERARSFASF